MKLKVEVSIDLDQNRKIWVTGSGTFDPGEQDEHEIKEVIDALTEAVTGNALAAYGQTVPRFKMPESNGDEADKLRGEGKETDPLGTFGD